MSLLLILREKGLDARRRWRIEGPAWLGDGQTFLHEGEAKDCVLTMLRFGGVREHSGFERYETTTHEYIVLANVPSERPGPEDEKTTNPAKAG